MCDCGEFFLVLTSAMALVSCICQIIGFFSPYWFCNYSTGVFPFTGRCQMKGLFLTCPESGSCFADVPDVDVISLAATSLLINVPCTIAIVYITGKQLKKRGEVYFSVGRCFATTFYLFGELLTGVPAILVFIRFDEIGWSSVLFCTAGVLVFSTFALFIKCCLPICCAAAAKSR